MSARFSTCSRIISGLKGIDTLEQLAEIKRVVIEVATDCAVLNADDPLVLKMSGYIEAKNICYVTMNPQHAFVREHIRAGGRACALEAGVNGQMITLYDRGSHIPLVLDAFDSGNTRRSRDSQRAERDVCRGDGVLAGHQAGCDPAGPAHVRHHVLPGARPHERVQRAPVQGAVRLRSQRARGGAMADLAQRLDVTGRRIVVLAGPGDRRDEDLHAIAKAVAGKFDHYVCRRDDNLRQREGDEVPRIMAQALMAEGVGKDAISIIPDEQEAIDAALKMGHAGRSAADLRRRAHALVEADHEVPSGWGAGGARPSGATTAHAVVTDAAADAPVFASLEGLLRDERGIRLAPEVDD